VRDARYVHKLFEREGLTFSAFILDRRLSRAHRFLSEPRLADRKISSVAFDVGFGDLFISIAYFAAATAPLSGQTGDLPH
jgi:AraC-like DNA-binding protein